MPEFPAETLSYDQIVKLAGRYARNNVNEQRLNFAYSSARLDGLPVAMASVMYSTPDIDLTEEGRANVDAAQVTKNLLTQFDYILDIAEQYGKSAQVQSPVDIAMVRDLHVVTMKSIVPTAGEFRKSAIRIHGNPIDLPDADQIPALMEDFEQYLTSNWLSATGPHLAAYALWRLLWIHPFQDGNGRVGRALAYLILNLKAGYPLPGTPTLPELLAENRGAYYDALQAADSSYRRGRVDVSELRKLIESLIARQLGNIPVLNESTYQRLRQVVSRRIDYAPSAVKIKCYRTERPFWKLWSLGKYYLLIVDSSENLRSVNARQINFGSPVEGLLSDQEDGAILSLGAGQDIGLVENQVVEISEKKFVYLKPGQSMGLSNISLKSSGRPTISIKGAAYVIRLSGSEGTFIIDQYFDVLISRHIRAASY